MKRSLHHANSHVHFLPMMLRDLAHSGANTKSLLHDQLIIYICSKKKKKREVNVGYLSIKKKKNLHLETQVNVFATQYISNIMVYTNLIPPKGL